MVDKTNYRAFNSRFTMRILVGISLGKRPSSIARGLNVTQQRLNRYVRLLLKAKAIAKAGTKGGVLWELTPKGSLILNALLRRSLGAPRLGLIPVRVHDVTFNFRIKTVPDSLDLGWRNLRNGVRKSKAMRYSGYTVEIVESGAKWASILEVHMPPVYAFNHFNAVIQLYNKARDAALLMGERFHLEVSDKGYLTKRPHLAFERELIAQYLAVSETAEAPASGTNGGMVWFDESNGLAELETNEPDYAYLYLTTPRRVMENTFAIEHLQRSTGYLPHFHPVQTVNN